MNCNLRLDSLEAKTEENEMFLPHIPSGQRAAKLNGQISKNAAVMF